jgi:hypothetical protein
MRGFLRPSGRGYPSSGPGSGSGRTSAPHCAFWCGVSLSFTCGAAGFQTHSRGRRRRLGYLDNRSWHVSFARKPRNCLFVPALQPQEIDGRHDRNTREHGIRNQPPRSANPGVSLPLAARPCPDFVGSSCSHLSCSVGCSAGLVVGPERCSGRVSNIHLVASRTLVDGDPQLFSGFDGDVRVEPVATFRRRF